MRKAAAFVRLSRPKFLVGGFVGFALGAAIARYEGARVTPALYVAGQAMITAFHLMTHYANDYFDRESDRAGRPTDFSGGSGVLVAGTLPARAALTAALVCAAVGMAGAAAFALAGLPVAAAIGTAVGALAWSYSAPPLRLAGRGWGELDTALVVAILVPLAGYAVFSRTVDGLALTATLAPACAMFAMMIAVEWPDRDADRIARKRNLLVRLGSAAAARLAAGCALAIVPALFLAIGRGAPWLAAVLGLLLVPAISGFVRRLDSPHVPPTEIASRGVTMFVLTVTFETLGYILAGR